MINHLFLAAPSLIPQMTQTFGASAVVMSPLFELFLIAVAILLIIAFFKYTEANSFFRNLMAGYGLFELLKNGFNYLFSSNQNQNQNQNIIVHHHHRENPRIYTQSPPNVIHGHSSSHGMFNRNHGHPTHNQDIAVGHRHEHFHGHA